jgi:hypothetical protein
MSARLPLGFTVAKAQTVLLPRIWNSPVLARYLLRYGFGHVRNSNYLTQQPAIQTELADVRSTSLPRIELAGDAADAWKLVSPFVSEEIL